MHGRLAYCRFARNEAIIPLKGVEPPAELKSVHEAFVTARHQTVGHKDATLTEGELPVTVLAMKRGPRKASFYPLGVHELKPWARQREVASHGRSVLSFAQFHQTASVVGRPEGRVGLYGGVEFAARARQVPARRRPARRLRSPIRTAATFVPRARSHARWAPLVQRPRTSRSKDQNCTPIPHRYAECLHVRPSSKSRSPASSNSFDLCSLPASEKCAVIIPTLSPPTFAVQTRAVLDPAPEELSHRLHTQVVA